jgi:hypothetical protein
MYTHLNTMKPMTKRKLHLKYQEMTDNPQMVVAIKNKKVIGYYLFVPEPIKVGDTFFHFIIVFNPTNEIYYSTQGYACINILEQCWQLYRASQMNL